MQLFLYERSIQPELEEFVYSLFLTSGAGVSH